MPWARWRSRRSVVRVSHRPSRHRVLLLEEECEARPPSARLQAGELLGCRSGRHPTAMARTTGPVRDEGLAQLAVPRKCDA
jgi:hypothetical protein